MNLLLMAWLVIGIGFGISTLVDNELITCKPANAGKVHANFFYMTETNNKIMSVYKYADDNNGWHNKPIEELMIPAFAMVLTSTVFMFLALNMQDYATQIGAVSVLSAMVGVILIAITVPRVDKAMKDTGEITKPDCMIGRTAIFYIMSFLAAIAAEIVSMQPGWWMSLWTKFRSSLVRK